MVAALTLAARLTRPLARVLQTWHDPREPGTRYSAYTVSTPLTYARPVTRIPSFVMTRIDAWFPASVLATMRLRPSTSMPYAKMAPAASVAYPWPQYCAATPYTNSSCGGSRKYQSPANPIANWSLRHRATHKPAPSRSYNCRLRSIIARVCDHCRTWPSNKNRRTSGDVHMRCSSSASAQATGYNVSLAVLSTTGAQSTGTVTAAAPRLALQNPEQPR